MTWADEVQAQIEAARKLLAKNRAALPAVFAFAHTLPIPAWIKAPDGTMLWVNREFEVRYGKSLEAYHGRKDSDMWDAESAEAYSVSDQEAIARRGAYRFTEKAPMPDGRVETLDVIKIPVYDRETGVLIGVGGIVL